MIPAAVRKLSVPVIASGGIGDGRGMAAALALGAEGVNMGTRFSATVEAPMHENIKRALVEASEVDTRLIFRTLKNTARVLKNEISETVLEIEAQPGATDFADLRPLVAGARGKAALASGDVDDGVITAGMVVGLIDDIPTCAELIQRMVREAREHLARASGYF